MRLNPPHDVQANPGPPGFARFGAFNFARSRQLVGLTSWRTLAGLGEKTFLQEILPTRLSPRTPPPQLSCRKVLLSTRQNTDTACREQAVTGWIAMPSRE
jgi:hypothetical protein